MKGGREQHLLNFGGRSISVQVLYMYSSTCSIATVLGGGGGLSIYVTLVFK